MNAGNARFAEFVGRERDAEEAHIPEEALWQAVIDRALWDSIGLTGGTSHSGKAQEMETHTARIWFERNGPDFRETCYLAGRDPDDVRGKAMAVIAAFDADPEGARSKLGRNDKKKARA